MEPERDSHPVVMGLVALVGVGLAVGLLISGGALAATHVLGLSGGRDAGGASDRQSLYLPKPSHTATRSSPLLTLQPGASSTAPTTAPPTPTFTISLSAGETEVGQLEQIDLTGTYPGGEGRILAVQRFENGAWVDFAGVDTAVSNGTFSTYVETAKLGANRFRVRDTDGDAVSNEISVQVDG